MKKLIFTTLLATLAAGFSLTLSAADKPAACPAAKKSCCEAPAGKAYADCNKAKAADCAKPKADCCKKPDAATCDKDKKDKAACTKSAESCPKCAAGKTAATANAASDTCPVSGEKLGSMGEPYVHTHKEAGKSDVSVSLCCKMCVKSFEKNAAKHLATLAAN